MEIKDLKIGQEIIYGDYWKGTSKGKIVKIDNIKNKITTKSLNDGFITLDLQNYKKDDSLYNSYYDNLKWWCFANNKKYLAHMNKLFKARNKK